MRPAAVPLLLAALTAPALRLSAQQGGDTLRGSGSADPAWADTTLAVPAPAGAEPIVYPKELSQGERLVIAAVGQVRGFRPDPSGAIPAGALVASFNGGPPFLVDVPGDRPVGRDAGRSSSGQGLLWVAPADGWLAFAVAQGGRRRLSGGYSIRVVELGRRGDPRQARYPLPWIAFVVPPPGGAYLAVTYGDRSGFGLDRKTLSVIVDTEGGQRIVLTPYFRPDSAGATLPSLPIDVSIPRGVHRVTARIGDALGNVSPAAVIFLDQP